MRKRWETVTVMYLSIGERQLIDQRRFGIIAHVELHPAFRLAELRPRESIHIHLDHRGIDEWAVNRQDYLYIPCKET